MSTTNLGRRPRLVLAATSLAGVAVLTMGAQSCGATSGSAAPTTTAPSATAVTTQAAPATTSAPTVPPTTVSVSLQNAIRSAKQYLSMGSGFSRQGLIDQLSSSAGDGYPVADATAAVDGLGVDWDAQAALAAKTYLSTSAFSCSGLMTQLDATAGSQFTLAQAQFGAHAAGVC